MRLTRRTACLTTALLLGLCALAAPAHAQATWGQYGFDVLPMPTGYSVGGYWAVNDAGQVAAYRYTGSNYDSFIWDADSGAFTGTGSLGGGNTFAYGINDAGQVAGRSSNGAYDEAFLYDGSSMQGLGVAPRFSLAYSVNDAGQVVGYGRNASNQNEAFLYDGSSMQGLGTLGGSTSVGYDINNAGQVVGYSTNASGSNEAFLHDGTAMQGLGTLGGNSSYAYGINNAGQVVGYSLNASNRGEAFLHDGTSMHGLGSLGGTYSRASGISDAGQAVGNASGGTIGGTRAVLWEGGQGYFLDVLVGGGWTFTDARGVSDGGTILAVGRNAAVYNGASTYVVLRQHTVSVPEPSSVLLLLSGGLGIGLVARRRGGLARG